MIIIITFFKNLIDKLYYSKYNLGNQEALIRKMFPWIKIVWEYSQLELFLKDKTAKDLSDIKMAIMSYYWGENARLTLEWKFEEIKRIQWLVDFCQSLTDYVNELISYNNIK